MDFIQILYIIISCILIVFTVWFFYVLIFKIYIFSKPNNKPKHFLKKKNKDKTNDKKIILFIGDSLTQGSVSENYTNIVSDRFKENQYEYINAGINGELTFNVLKRLDEIINCNPDIITILIGSNDARGSITPESAKIYERTQKVPKDPEFWTEERFQKDLTDIIKRLKRESKAKIALLSIPPISETPGSLAFKRSLSYSNIIHNIAEENSITYLPLNEKMTSYIDEHPTNVKIPIEKSSILMLKAILAHYYRGWSWEKISFKRGFQILIDHVHINKVGASMVADIIEQFIRNL